MITSNGISLNMVLSEALSRGSKVAYCVGKLFVNWNYYLRVLSIIIQVIDLIIIVWDFGGYICRIWQKLKIVNTIVFFFNDA